MDDFEHRVHVDSGRVRYPGQEAIARLRAEVEALKLQRTAADLVHRDTSTTVLVQAGEIEELRRSNGALLRTKDALQRELARVRAEVEALRAKATAFDWLQAEHDRFDPMARCVIKRSMDRRNGDWIEFIDGENFAAIVLREASIDAARAAQQAEPVAKIIRNDSGQVRMVDGSGEPFDMFAHVGQSYYAHPPAAEVQRLREALKPFAAIDLTTNQAVDAMDVLRARRALEGK